MTFKLKKITLISAGQISPMFPIHGGNVLSYRGYVLKYSFWFVWFNTIRYDTIEEINVWERILVRAATYRLRMDVMLTYFVKTSYPPLTYIHWSPLANMSCCHLKRNCSWSSISISTNRNNVHNVLVQCVTFFIDVHWLIWLMILLCLCRFLWLHNYR